MKTGEKVFWGDKHAVILWIDPTLPRAFIKLIGRGQKGKYKVHLSELSRKRPISSSSSLRKIIHGECPDCGTPPINYQKGIECPGCGFREWLQQNSRK